MSPLGDWVKLDTTYRPTARQLVEDWNEAQYRTPEERTTYYRWLFRLDEPPTVEEYQKKWRD